MNIICITKNDHKKLVDLIHGKWSNDEYDNALLTELDRAKEIFLHQPEANGNYE